MACELLCRRRPRLRQYIAALSPPPLRPGCPPSVARRPLLHLGEPCLDLGDARAQATLHLVRPRRCGLGAAAKGARHVNSTRRATLFGHGTAARQPLSLSATAADSTHERAMKVPPSATWARLGMLRLRPPHGWPEPALAFTRAQRQTQTASSGPCLEQWDAFLGFRGQNMRQIARARARTSIHAAVGGERSVRRLAVSHAFLRCVCVASSWTHCSSTRHDLSIPSVCNSLCRHRPLARWFQGSDSPVAWRNLLPAATYWHHRTLRACTPQPPEAESARPSHVVLLPHERAAPDVIGQLAPTTSTQLPAPVPPIAWPMWRPKKRCTARTPPLRLREVACVAVENRASMTKSRHLGWTPCLSGKEDERRPAQPSIPMSKAREVCHGWSDSALQTPGGMRCAGYA